jgi:hypothetical protein
MQREAADHAVYVISTQHSFPSPNREQRFQGIGASISVQFVTWPFGFLSSRLALIAMVLAKATARLRSARRIAR